MPRTVVTRSRARPDWQTLLAPRLLLGIWHPIFLESAHRYLPLFKRYHIGFSPAVARRFFWDVCDGFSLNFGMLVGAEGQAFLADARAAGKEVCVWTVNDPAEMKVAMTWGVKAILTDKVDVFINLKKQVGSRELGLMGC